MHDVEKQETHFIVQVSQAKMPNSVKARYGNIAIIELPKHLDKASMISDRSKDIIRIVEATYRLHWGSKSPRTALERKRAGYNALCDALNNAPKVAPSGHVHRWSIATENLIACTKCTSQLTV